MKQDNRVLGRSGARQLTPREAELVAGAFKVFTVCTGTPPQGDGDCGPPPCEAGALARSISGFPVCTGRCGECT